ncbi:MAG TPA: DUF433 domain-containing protein [Verrucomicrobiae bacterium]
MSDPDHLGGARRIRDTRISVTLLLELLASGMSTDEIVDAYPSLSKESILNALGELAAGESSQAA